MKYNHLVMLTGLLRAFTSILINPSTTTIIPSVIPQVGSEEGRMYTNLTPAFVGAERLFLKDPRLKREEEKRKGRKREKRIQCKEKII